MGLVLIVGKGKSGQSAAKLLTKHGLSVRVVDDEDMLSDGEIDNLYSGLSFVVVSPGISLESRWVTKARDHKIKVIGELELGYLYNNGRVLAVTGTNGKTTVTTLIGRLMETVGKTWVGGNIGIPFTQFCEKTKPSDNICLEVSSFQLETISSFHPHIAALTNITPDHLNRHKTMQKYANTKLKIFKNMAETDFAVINADSEIVMRKTDKIRPKRIFFSTKKEVLGCFSQGGNIYFNDGLKKICVAKTKNIKLVGEHNLSNVLCAVAMFILAGGNPQNVKAVLQKFYGVEHRIEFVAKKKGVRFYNDSKATNPDSTLVAVNSFSEPIVLLLGGSDKGFSFDELFAKLPDNVYKIIVFGEVKAKLILAAKKYARSVIEANSIKEAVKEAIAIAPKNSVVLFSPAAASFDMFSNFEERGRFFKLTVREKLNENSQTKSKLQEKTGH